MDVGNDVLGVRDVTANIGNRSVGIYREFGLKTDGQKRGRGGNGTHVEDMKDPVEVQSPGRNPFFIILRVEKARNNASITQLDNGSLDLRYSPAINETVSKSGYNPYFRWLNSRCQLLDCLEYGAAELIRLSATHPTIKSLADPSAY